jgi:hypothetical protein
MDFREVKSSLEGIAGRQLEAISVIPIEISKIFEQEKPTGVHRINIAIDLPEGWAERIVKAMQTAIKNAFH